MRTVNDFFTKHHLINTVLKGTLKANHGNKGHAIKDVLS